MSQSLAAAKKRRAPIQQPEPVSNRNVPPPSQNTSNIQTGLTLPQVIQVVDRRLLVLEKFMQDSKAVMQDPPSVSLVSAADFPQSLTPESAPSSLQELTDEFDKRYEMLAEEIVNLKNIVLSLQSYTMEVNKTLMEERVRIFSDLETTEQSFTTENV